LRCIPPFGQKGGGVCIGFSASHTLCPLWTVDACISLLDCTPRATNRKGKFEVSCFGHPCPTELPELCGTRACATNLSLLAHARIFECACPMFCNSSQIFFTGGSGDALSSRLSISMKGGPWHRPVDCQRWDRGSNTLWRHSGGYICTTCIQILSYIYNSIIHHTIHAYIHEVCTCVVCVYPYQSTTNRH